ncbi:MAG TPA: EAL domain-containing protein [Candidatus Competibacteraceae bacterium]|nr:EAL domain-containing protein [Candidatus Competibacteraceae bacterium]
MSAQAVINLLVVDRALSDIENLVQVLRGAGYVVQVQHTDQEGVLEELLQTRPADLVMVRIGAGLPSLRNVTAILKRCTCEAPVLAIVDGECSVKPVELLRQGADNIIPLDSPEHIILVTSKELRHHYMRQLAQHSAARLKELEERSQALLDSSRDAIAYIHEGAHIYANPAYLQLFGYGAEAELEGVTLMNMVTRDDRDKLKNYLRRSTKAGALLEPIALTGLHSDGHTTFPIVMNCLPTRINDEPCLQIMIRAAAAQEASPTALEAMRHDIATGLYNRRYFIEYLNQVRSQTASGRPAGAVFYILLTDYRANSEKLGLEAVDQLVIDLAGRLKEMMDGQSVLARFSDAVFTVYTPLTERAQVTALAEQMRDLIRDHVTHSGHKLASTRCAIGICPIKGEYESAFQIVALADRACEAARQAGPNQVQVYTPPAADTGESAQEKTLLAQIRDAIAQERLELWYQPIASFQDAGQERYQTYLQLLDEQRRPLSLRELLPLASRRGLMYPLEKWAIVKMLEQLTLRYQQERRMPALFLRLTDNTITAADFVPWLELRLKDTGLSGQVLVMEIDEDDVEQYFKEVRTLRVQLQRLGCGFAISHFGGKANSERILRHLKPDYIELDGSLIERLAKSREEEPRVAMAQLTALAQEMRVQVVAADISSAPQMASIWQYGVTLVQGDMVHAASREMDFDFEQFAA